MTALVVQRQSGWLLFDAPLPDSVSSLAPGESVGSGLLTLGSELPAGCKYAFVAGSGLRLRAERLEPHGAEAASRILEIEAEVASGFAAASRLRCRSRGSAENGVGDRDPGEAPPPDLASRCREVGWLCEERSSGSVTVDLGVPGTYLPALVEARGQGILVEAELVDSLPDGRTRRDALAALLLRANGVFRGVRAVFRRESVEDVAQAGSALLESPLPPNATAGELASALGALAVSARHCALEARILASDERIARAYSTRCRREAPMPSSSPRASETPGIQSLRLDGQVGPPSPNPQGE